MLGENCQNVERKLKKKWTNQITTINSHNYSTHKRLKNGDHVRLKCVICHRYPTYALYIISTAKIQYVHEIPPIKAIINS